METRYLYISTYLCTRNFNISCKYVKHVNKFDCSWCPIVEKRLGILNFPCQLYNKCQLNKLANLINFTN